MEIEPETVGSTRQSLIINKKYTDAEPADVLLGEEVKVLWAKTQFVIKMKVGTLPRML